MVDTTVVIYESVKRHIPVSKTPPFGAFIALAPGQSFAHSQGALVRFRH
jgi:hypothetical protein